MPCVTASEGSLNRVLAVVSREGFDVLLLLEHPSVYTLGRSSKVEDVKFCLDENPDKHEVRNNWFTALDEVSSMDRWRDFRYCVSVVLRYTALIAAGKLLGMARVRWCYTPS